MTERRREPVPPTQAATGPRRRYRWPPDAIFGGPRTSKYSINGIIELGRRIARGFRNFEHYRLRMLLIAGGLDASPHTQL